MIYILKQAGVIVGFGETPFVLGEDQTQSMVDATMEDYAGRFRLTADKYTIQADGVDQAIVSLYSNAAPMIDVLVNGVTVTVYLTSGTGQLPPITSEVAGTFEVKPSDETIFSRAGEGTLTINAV